MILFTSESEKHQSINAILFMEDKNMEEKKVLTEEEVNQVDGGTSIRANVEVNLIARCSKCGSNNIEVLKHYLIPGGPVTSINYVCKDCGYSWTILPKPGPRQG